MCENRPADDLVQKLWRALAGRSEEQLRLAGLVAKASGSALALYDELLETASGDVLRSAVEGAIAVCGEGGLEWVARTLSDEARPELIALVLDKARAEARLGALVAPLELLASKLPSRRSGLLAEIVELHREAGRTEAVVQSLASLIAAESDSKTRVGYRLQLAQLYAAQLAHREDAQEALERALEDDPESAAAARQLVELLSESDQHERFVAACERLSALGGEDAAIAYRERLAKAYDALGRESDAYRLLGELEETPERLQRRVELADALGLTEESLALREKLALAPGELEAVLLDYARAGLTPAAARVAERMLATQALSAIARRELAERFSSRPDVAGLAARLWPEMLRANPSDGAGWMLFAEALQHSRRGEAARLARGFGAALGGAPETAPAVAIRPMERAKLGARHPTPSWLVDEDELVLGAGALGVFGPIELGWLCALALALGPKGVALSRQGHEPALAEAALAAFDANPTSLAACRVLAHLDPSVRGGDPASVYIPAVLRGSDAFRAIAFRALELI